MISNMTELKNSTASNVPIEMNNMDDVILSSCWCENSVDISFDHVVLVDTALVDVFSAVDGPRGVSVAFVEAFCVGVAFSYAYSVDALGITFVDVLSVGVGIHCVDVARFEIDSIDVVCARNDSVDVAIGEILSISIFPFAVVSIVLISIGEISRYVDLVDVSWGKLRSVDSVFSAILCVLSVESFRVEEFSVIDSVDDDMVDVTFETVLSGFVEVDSMDCVPFEAPIIGVLFCVAIFSDDISSGDVISVGIFSVDHFSVGRILVTFISAVEALSVRNDSGNLTRVRMASVEAVSIENASVDAAVVSISVFLTIVDVSFDSNASVIIVPTGVPYSVLSVEVASDGLYSVEVISGVSTIGMEFVVFSSDNAFSVDVMSVDVAIIEI